MSRLRRIRGFAWLVLFFCISGSYVAAQPLLKQGVLGEEVLQLQTKLKEIGYLDGTVTGQFDDRTRLAVVDFQLDNDLEPDGVVGDKTKLALRESKTVAVNRGERDSRRAAAVVVMAKQFLGVPYVWAGAAPGGFDCSGFVYYMYSKIGVYLPRMADGQFEVGLPVKRNELLPGDLVFFSTYEQGPSHCGIYIGGNYFIHASSGAGEVTITSMGKAYYAERYIGARRVLR